MATNMPTALDTPVDPSASQFLSSPSHSGQHTNANDAIVAVEQIVVGPFQFNVKGYGATGNGSTDDITAINSAISAASSAGGGTVFFPAGTYIVSNMVQVPSNVTILGVKGASTVKAKSGSWSSVSQVGSITGIGVFMTTGNTTASNITIRNITIDGNQTGITALPGWITGSNTCGPLHMNNVTGLVLDGVHVINGIGYAVYLETDTYVIITGCNVLTGQTGSAQGWGTPVTQDAVHIASSSYVIIDGNVLDTGTLATVGDDGIAVQSYAACHDYVITNNIIRSAAAGIDLALSGFNIFNVVISNNDIWAALSSAIISQPFTGSGAVSYNITVQGNTITNPVSSSNTNKGAICFFDYANIASPAQGWRDVSIIGNTIVGCSFGVAAIYCRFGTTLTIQGNSIYGSTVGRFIQVGDDISGSCPVTDFTIVGNSINASASTATPPYGIVVYDSQDGVVSSNIVLGPSGPVSGSIGIILFTVATAVTGVTVSSNRVTTWAAAIDELTGGDYNLFVANNTHSSTAGVTTTGAHSVSASNL